MAAGGAGGASPLGSINKQALINYAQNLIDSMLRNQGQTDDGGAGAGGGGQEQHSCEAGHGGEGGSKKLSSLQQARIIVRFLYLKNQPTQNRQFYEYFFDQQQKADSIDQLLKLKNIMGSVRREQEQ